MSVLIKGMEMPKGCDDCSFESIMCCFLLEKRLAIETFKKGERDKDCPLVEINDEKIVKVATLEDVRDAVDWAVGEIKGGMDWVETKDLKGYPLKEIIAMAESGES